MEEVKKIPDIKNLICRYFVELVKLQKGKGMEYIFLIPYLIDEEWEQVDAYGYMEHLEYVYGSVGFKLFNDEGGVRKGREGINILYLELNE